MENLVLFLLLGALSTGWPLLYAQQLRECMGERLSDFILGCLAIESETMHMQMCTQLECSNATRPVTVGADRRFLTLPLQLLIRRPLRMDCPWCPLGRPLQPSLGTQSWSSPVL